MDPLTAMRAFVRLVERETFTAAAHDLRVKQSTVSKWVAALEDDLGVALVDRTTRSLHVTDAGRRFYRRAAELLADYDAAVAEVREEACAIRGRVRMSVPVVFGQRFVVPRLAELLTRHEGLELELFFADRYVNLVEEGFDVAVRVGTPVDSSLTSHLLGDGPRRLVASPAYVAKHGAPRTPKELERQHCLVHAGPSPRATWTFQKGGRTYTALVGGRVAANHSEATLVMAKAGLGIALLAGWLVDEDLAAGALVSLLPAYAPPTAPVRALTPPGRRLPPRVRVVIDHLRQAAGAR